MGYKAIVLKNNEDLANYLDEIWDTMAVDEYGWPKYCLYSMPDFEYVTLVYTLKPKKKLRQPTKKALKAHIEKNDLDLQVKINYGKGAEIESFTVMDKNDNHLYTGSGIGCKRYINKQIKIRELNSVRKYLELCLIGHYGDNDAENKLRNKEQLNIINQEIKRLS